MASFPTVRRLYPFRYWLAIAYMVGVPGFQKFDPNAPLHSYGIFYPQSIALIAMTLACASAFAVLTLSSSRPIFMRRIRIPNWQWVLLILILTIASFLSPRGSVLISLYRMFELGLLYCLIASLYTRGPIAESAFLLRDLLMKLVNICIGIISIVAVVLPSAGLWSVSEMAPGELDFRLGGIVFQPNALGVLADIAILHTLIYRKGGKRVFLLCFYGAVLVLTISRGAWVGLVIAMMLYFLSAPGKMVKAYGALSMLAAGVVGFLLRNVLIRQFERGNGLKGVETLSERVPIWASAWRAFRLRPWLGYGYIDGVKYALKQHGSHIPITLIHCHNEIVQALVSGGILCGLLVLFIYLHTLYRYVVQRLRHPRDRDSLFFFFVFVVSITGAFLRPTITYLHSPEASIFLLCYLACHDGLPLSRIALAEKKMAA